MRITLQALAFFLIVLIISSCAPLAKPDIHKKKLTARVSQLMEAKIADDWDQVYDIFCPAYRKEISRKQFSRFKRVTFVKYRIGTIDFEEDAKTAHAQVYISISSNGFTFPEQPQQQIWRKQKGIWCQDVPPTSLKTIFSND